VQLRRVGAGPQLRRDARGARRRRREPTAGAEPADSLADGDGARRGRARRAAAGATGAS
jgi:hypothetical protein